MVKVKICGLTRESDALAACSLGADALGFNFWPGSIRYCRPAVARRIRRALPPFVSAVGVFVNQPRDEILRVAELVGLDWLQLHGDEPPAFCTRWPLPIIKAVRAETKAGVRALKRYRVAAYLLDAPSAGYGGSGRTFDWRLACEARGGSPLILAGGLTPRNVRRAILIARPHAVDAASGVESAPGFKDALAMARFIRAAKGAIR